MWVSELNIRSNMVLYIRVYGFSVDVLLTSGLQRRNVLLNVFSRSIRHRGTTVRRHRNATSLCFFKNIRSNRYNTTHIIIPIWRGSFAVFCHIIYFYIVSCSDPHELHVSTYKTTRMLTSDVYHPGSQLLPCSEQSVRSAIVNSE